MRTAAFHDAFLVARNPFAMNSFFLQQTLASTFISIAARDVN